MGHEISMEDLQSTPVSHYACTFLDMSTDLLGDDGEEALGCWQVELLVTQVTTQHLQQQVVFDDDVRHGHPVQVAVESGECGQCRPVVFLARHTASLTLHTQYMG